MAQFQFRGRSLRGVGYDWAPLRLGAASLWAPHHIGRRFFLGAATLGAASLWAPHHFGRRLVKYDNADKKQLKFRLVLMGVARGMQREGGLSSYA